MSERNESLGEGARGDSRIKSRNQQRIIFLGEVIDVDDPSAAGRIRVRIKGFDDKPLDEPPTPWSKEDPLVCFPFLPLHINLIPKLGETAKIILYDSKNDQYIREYIGPLVPQLGSKLIESPNYPDSKRGRPDYPLPYEQSINKIVTAEGIYPKKDEVAIQGRDNADLIFKPSEVIIRASKFLPGKPTERNDVNPAYIQIKTVTPGKFNSTIEIESTKNLEHKNFLQKELLSKTRTDINLVSNKIYLIGRDDNSSIIKPYFTEEDEISIEEKLHPIVYGDILKNFINILWRWIQNHVHGRDSKPNKGDDAFKELENWMLNELSSLNSKNIFAGGDFDSVTSTNKKILEASRGTGPIGSTKNNLVNEIEVRVNSSISRVDDINQPLISITAVKVCDDNLCKVEFDIINNASGEVIIKIEGTGGNELLAYQNVLTNLYSYLSDNNIPISDVNIPGLNKIKVF